MPTSTATCPYFDTPVFRGINVSPRLSHHIILKGDFTFTLVNKRRATSDELLEQRRHIWSEIWGDMGGPADVLGQGVLMSLLQADVFVFQHLDQTATQ